MVFIIENVISKLIIYIICLYIICFNCNLSLADAWNQKKHSGIIITSIDVKTFKGINELGVFDENKTINHTIFSLYGEFGLTNRITIGGKILAIDAIQMKNNQIFNKVQNRSFALDTSQIFTRVKLFQNDIFVISAATILGFPSVYKENIYLSPYFSIKKWNYEPRFEFGVNIDEYNFLILTTGYHRNINHWYDEIRFEITYGFKLSKLLLMVKLQKYVYITTNKDKAQQLAENNKNFSIYDVLIQSGFAKINVSFAIPIDKNLNFEFGFYSSLRSKLLFTDNLKLNLYGVYASLWYNFSL